MGADVGWDTTGRLLVWVHSGMEGVIGGGEGTGATHHQHLQLRHPRAPMAWVVRRWPLCRICLSLTTPWRDAMRTERAVSSVVRPEADGRGRRLSRDLRKEIAFYSHYRPMSFRARIVVCVMFVLAAVKFSCLTPLCDVEVVFCGECIQVATCTCDSSSLS